MPQLAGGLVGCCEGAPDNIRRGGNDDLFFNGEVFKSRSVIPFYKAGEERDEKEQRDVELAAFFSVIFFEIPFKLFEGAPSFPAESEEAAEACENGEDRKGHDPADHTFYPEEDCNAQNGKAGE